MSFEGNDGFLVNGAGLDGFCGTHSEGMSIDLYLYLIAYTKPHHII
jgi:hypothetical protein